MYLFVLTSVADFELWFRKCTLVYVYLYAKTCSPISTKSEPLETFGQQKEFIVCGPLYLVNYLKYTG